VIPTDVPLLSHQPELLPGPSLNRCAYDLGGLYAGDPDQRHTNRRADQQLNLFIVAVTKPDLISHRLVHDAWDAEDTRPPPPHQPTTYATQQPDDSPGLAEAKTTITPWCPSPPRLEDSLGSLAPTCPATEPIANDTRIADTSCPSEQQPQRSTVPTKFQTTATCSPYLRQTSTNWSPASK
jgi:hypothetical protein